MISIGSRRITGIYLGSSRVKAVSVGALEIWGGLPSPSLVVETASPIKVSGQAPFKQLFFIKARIDNDDGQHRIEYSYPQLSYVRGDGPSFAISSASELNGSFDVTVRLMRGDAMVFSQTVNVQVAISSSVELSVPNLSLSVSGEAGTDVRGSIGATIDNDDGHHSLRYEYPSKPWLSGNGDSFTVNSPSELNESFAVRVVLIKDMEGEVSSETVTVSVKIAGSSQANPNDELILNEYYVYDGKGGISFKTMVEGCCGPSPMAPIDVSDSAGNVIWHKEDGYPNPNRADIDPKYKVTSIAGLFDYRGDNFIDGSGTCWCGWFKNSDVSNPPLFGMSVDLSKFDMSGIVDISDLFTYSCMCGATGFTIDLSSLDTTKVTSHSFECAEKSYNVIFSKGYAKTQSDADNLTAWTGVPFEVKP